MGFRKVVDVRSEDLLTLYKAMRQGRLFDRALTTLRSQGRLAFHLGSLGEEATSAASAYVLMREDWLFPAFRDVPAFLVRGVPLDHLAHQALGSTSSPTLGRPLPLYFADVSRRIAMTGAGGAAHLVHAVGTAWAAKLRREPVVAVTSFNRGAIASGECHAALNFAAVFQAPVVFLCRNRMGDTASHGSGAMASAKGESLAVALRARGYGIPGVCVDGSDILALVAVLQPAIERARSGRGPTLIEAVIENLPNRDPVLLLERHLIAQGKWGTAKEEVLTNNQAADINRALGAAARSGNPLVASLWSDVVAPQPGRRCQAMKPLNGAH